MWINKSALNKTRRKVTVLTA